MRPGFAVTAVVSLLAALTVLAGCGGEGGLPGGAGSVEVQVDWPTDGEVQADVPPRQVSIEARFLDVNLRPLRDIGIRWVNFPETRLQLDNIPAGDYALQLVGYPQPNAQGDPQRVACVHVRVEPGGRVRLDVTFDREPHAMTFWPDPLRLEEGETRQLLTNVVTQDGKTVILGGLGQQFDYEITKGKTKLSVDPAGRVTAGPLLENLPFKGRLFGQHKDSGVQRELLVLVTPKIISD